MYELQVPQKGPEISKVKVPQKGPNIVILPHDTALGKNLRVRKEMVFAQECYASIILLIVNI